MFQHCSDRQRHRHDIQHRSLSSRHIVRDARSPVLCASRLLGHGQRGAQCSYRLLALYALIALFRTTAAWLCLAHGNPQGPTKYRSDLTDRID